jgi:serine/threonine protein kinase
MYAVFRQRLRKISPEGRDLVDKMLEIDPIKRVSASEVGAVYSYLMMIITFFIL